MATIKAGTYRFNDVLTQSTNYTVEGAILFNSSVNGETITCNGIYDRSLDDWLTLAYSVYITELGDYMEANVYNDGWYTDDFGDGIKTITIPTDSEVSDEFYAWFTANAVSQGADVSTTTVITYKGSTIATLEGGKTATLKCKGMKMESDVVVKAAEQTESTPPNIQPLTITENGTYTAEDGVDGYSPITVEVESGGEGDPLDLFIEGGYAEVNLPNATKIRDYGFYYDKTITNIVMPKVTSIGRYSFGYCSNLAQSSLPSGLTSIGSYAFRDCSQLALTELPSGITQIDNEVFFGCSKLALTELPSGLKTIGSYAFCKCSNLALTELPSGITSIGQNAFSNCTKLAVSTLPSGVTYLNDSAFRNCTSIVSMEIPIGITNVVGAPFRDCTGLVTVTFRGKPIFNSPSPFSGCTNLKTINVPWAEGEVSGAPWGATNATINYNHTGG